MKTPFFGSSDRCLPLAVVLATGPLFVCFGALAAESNLEEVVVTASHRAERPSEVPMSLQWLGPDSNAGSAALNGMEDLVESLNGVQAAVANGSQVAFQIRGIGAVDHQALTPGAAAVYSDGVFLATNVQTSGLLYDLDRVEVLKGPQGTLYGRNASSGAINFISVRPSAGQRGYLDASLGRFNRRDVRAAVGASLNDQTHLRLAGRILKQDAALSNVTGGGDGVFAPRDAAGLLDEIGLRASVNVEDGVGGGGLLLRAHYEEDNGVNPSPRNDSLQVGDFELSLGGDGTQRTDNEFFGVSSEWAADVLGWDVVSVSALEGYNQRYGFDFDGTPAPFGNPNLNANLAYDRDYLQISQELRLRRPVDWGELLVGASLSVDDFEQTYTIWCGDLDSATLIGSCPYVGAPGRVGPTPPTDAAPMTLVTDIAQKRELAALFSRTDIDVTPVLGVTLGARLTQERIEGEGEGRHIFADGVTALNNRDNAGLARGANVIDDLTFSGDLAVRYTIEPGMIYATLARSFKSGGFNGEVANNALHYADEGLFGQETVMAAELGFKAAPSDRLEWSIAGFYQHYDAPQARIFVDFELPDGSRIVSNSLSNLDEARSLGLEAQVRWRPTTSLGLEGGLTLLDTEIRQRSDLGGNAQLFDGNPLPFASEVSALFAAVYEFQLSPDIAADFRLAAKYRSEFFLDAEGLDARRQAAYTTVSADLSVRPPVPGLELTVFGRNLLDEDFAVSGFGFIGYNTFRSNPMNYGVRARYSF